MELKLTRKESRQCWIMVATADRAPNDRRASILCPEVAGSIHVYFWDRYKKCARDMGVYLTEAKWEACQTNITFPVFIASECRLFTMSAGMLMGILPPPPRARGGGAGGGSAHDGKVNTKLQ
jgi:hypothetical protein